MAEEGESTVALDRAASCAVHWMPCSIQHTGEAPVSTYFMPQPAAGPEAQADGRGAASQEAAFRGRQLRGATLQLPQGFEGFVLRKPQADAGAGRAWQMDSCFSELTYWNHDTPPSSSDNGQRTFEWLALSTAVHSPISTEQVEAKMKR